MRTVIVSSPCSWRHRQAQFAGEGIVAHAEQRSARVVLERRTAVIELVRALGHEITDEAAPGGDDGIAVALEWRDGVKAAANQCFARIRQRQAGRQLDAGVVTALVGM